MKLLTITAFFFLLALVIYNDRPPAPQRVHEEIRPGKVDVPLREIGLTGQLRKGTRIHFRPGLTACAVLVDSAESHEFGEGVAAQGLLIRWNEGKQEWIRRDWMDHCWIE